MAATKAFRTTRAAGIEISHNGDNLVFEAALPQP